MTQEAQPDPAAHTSGGVGDFTPARTHAPALPRVLGRWWVIALCIGVALMGAAAYLATATPTFTASAELIADQLAPSPGGDVPPDEFLFQQRDLIQSPKMLAAAGLTAQDDRLEVEVVKGEGLIALRLGSPDAQEAARQLNALTSAYLKTRTGQSGGAVNALTELTQKRDRLAAARAEKERALREQRSVAGASGGAGDSSRLEHLNSALATARDEVATATAALEAAQAALSDPTALAGIIEANRAKGIFGGVDQQKQQIEAELKQLETQYENQQKSMLPQHPVVVATLRKIEQVKIRLAQVEQGYAEIYRKWLGEQQAAAQKKLDELTMLVNEQAKRSNDDTTRATALQQLEEQVKTADAALAEVDRQVRDVTLTGDAAMPTLKLVHPAQPPRHPSHPDRRSTLLTAAALGLVAGIALAALPRPRGRAGAARPPRNG